jgi:hypothetical protein
MKNWQESYQNHLGKTLDTLELVIDKSSHLPIYNVMDKTRVSANQCEPKNLLAGCKSNTNENESIILKPIRFL